MLNELQAELKKAMAAKDELRLMVMRGLVSAIRNREIELRGQSKEMVEQDEIAVVQKELKKRKEAAELYRQGNREDLASKEEVEAAIVETFLPAMLSAEEIKKLVEEAIAETGAASAQDFGKVMKAVTAKTQGRAEGSQISAMVKEKLQ